MLFAYYPEFAKQHSRSRGAFTEIELDYRFESRLVFAGEGGGVVARSTLPLVALTMDDADGDPPILAPGIEFSVQPLTVYRTPQGSFSVVVRAAHASGGGGNAGEISDAAPAVRVTVENGPGEVMETILVRGTGAASSELDGRVLSTEFGPRRMVLPYSIRLEDFALLTYPGSNKPSGFESHVQLIDPDHGINARPHVVRMNSPLTHRSRKHFQSSYDKDQRGTILTVNYDPGKWPTYFGYALITLGFLLSLLKNAFWPVPTGGLGRIRGMSVLALGVLVPVLFASAVPASAQASEEHAGHGPQDPQAVLALPSDLRSELGSLVMQDFQGRMKPLDTLAQEIIRKVTRRARFGEWEPVDLYLSWIAAPDYWWEQPLIYVRHPGLKEILGVSPSTSHVSPASLFADPGDYRLLAHVEAAYRRPDRDRSKVQRKLIAFDERLNIIYLTLQGRTLRAYPVPGDPGHAWDSGGQVVPKVEPALQTRYKEAHLSLIGGLQAGNVERIRRGLAETRTLQSEYGAEVLPGSLALGSELLLNQSRLLDRVLWPYFLAFVLLLPAYFAGFLRLGARAHEWRRRLFSAGMAVFTLGFLAHLLAYVLRWIASGRAPLSNGYESLLFISLAVGLAGLLFQWRDRQGAAARAERTAGLRHSRNLDGIPFRSGHRFAGPGAGLVLADHPRDGDHRQLRLPRPRGIPRCTDSLPLPVQGAGTRRGPARRGASGCAAVPCDFLGDRSPDHRYPPRRRVGQRVVGTILGLGSQGDLEPGHHPRLCHGPALSLGAGVEPGLDHGGRQLRRFGLHRHDLLRRELLPGRAPLLRGRQRARSALMGLRGRGHHGRADPVVLRRAAASDVGACPRRLTGCRRISARKSGAEPSARGRVSKTPQMIVNQRDKRRVRGCSRALSG